MKKITEKHNKNPLPYIKRDDILDDANTNRIQEPERILLKIEDIDLKTNEFAEKNQTPNNASPNSQISGRRKGKFLENFSTMVALHKHSILSTINEANTLKSLYNLLKFVIFKIMIPLFSFCLIIIGIIFIHIEISDFCFFSNLCSCQKTWVYLYTFSKELLHTYSPMIIVFYYGSSYITEDFHKYSYIKILYLCFQLLCLIATFSIDYDKKNEQILEYITIRNLFILFSVHLLFSLILEIIMKKISKEFFKRFALVVSFQAYLFFHRFYFKSYLLFEILGLIQNYMNVQQSLNFFKLLLLIYYIIYENLAFMVLFSIYKGISDDENNKYSLNIVIFLMKFVSVDILSIKALNILTISLLDVYTWVFFLSYFYSIFSVYSRSDFIQYLFDLFLEKILKFKIKKIEIRQQFIDIRSGCIFETNLIVFLRIIVFRTLDYFIIYSKDSILYEDCSLNQLNTNIFKLYDANIILLMITHTILLGIMGLFIFIKNKKKLLFHYIVEDINILGRMLFFIVCFTYADFSIQIYKHFEEVY